MSTIWPLRLNYAICQPPCVVYCSCQISIRTDY